MMYQLVFRGECSPGMDVQTARSNAMALFKATVDQVDRMFSGQRVVIRNKLDEAQVKKYQAVMRKHGMVAHIESMEGKSSAARPVTPDPARENPGQPVAGQPEQPKPVSGASASPGAAETATSRDSHSPPATQQPGMSVEPGDRLSVAGEQVDRILAGSSLQVSAVHERLSETVESEAPLFEHLDEWTLAPVGSELVEHREEMPVATPDISHLSLEDDGTQQW